MDSHNN